MLAPAVALTAMLGDQTGYFIGRRIGPALFKKEDSRFFKQHHVTESHAFFEKYGPMAIIMARFMPFVRTFTPVVAGVSYMRYPVFLAFDIVGGIAWGGGVTLLPATSWATSRSSTRIWKRSSWPFCSCR